MVNYDLITNLYYLSYTMYLYMTQMKRYKIHGKCIIDTDTRYLLKMYLDTRYKIHVLFMYLRYVSRYLYLRYSPALPVGHDATASRHAKCFCSKLGSLLRNVQGMLFTSVSQIVVYTGAFAAFFRICAI